METRLLTPTEMWEGFNPVKEGTETSIISAREKGNIATSDIFFTSEKTDAGRVRVFARITFDMRWRDPRPAILLLPSRDPERTFDDVTLSLVGEGYVVCLCDYAGNFAGVEEDSRTSYPDIYSYAQAPACFRNLSYIGATARETPWFQWVKVARRAVTMLSELRYVDPERIAVMGMDCGAQIAWQLAGIDGRIRALVPINGGGYLWRRGHNRFDDDTAVADDDKTRAFSAGVGAETYAKFVSCPTCYIVSSNSLDADIDRAGDILSLVPCQCKAFMVVKGSSAQVSLSVYNSLVLWLKTYFAHDAPSLPSPRLHFKADENRLYLRLSAPCDLKDATVCVSSGEPQSFARSWGTLAEGQLVDTGERVFHIPVSDPDDLVAAYASVPTDKGIVVCSPVAAVRPSSLGVKADVVSAAQSRIVYNGDMGTGRFRVSTRGFVLDETLLASREGPFGIKGVSTTKGNLCLALDSAESFATGRSAILQMDVHSEEAREITCLFLTLPDAAAYGCRVKLSGGDFWQKIKLSAPEMKNAEGKPLTSFGATRLMVIKGAENVVFNNLVWI